MMILPEVPKLQWRTSSQAQTKDMFGNENRTMFRIDARANDGGIVWTGCFDDRDDADAFLYAAIVGSLKYERELWNLCTPNWQPYLGDYLSYHLATTVYLTSPTNSNQTYTFPVDWSNSNTIECIGGGSEGGYGVSNVFGQKSASASGSGGGAYSKIYNYIKPGSTTTYNIGKGTGAERYVTASGNYSGASGSSTYFGGTTFSGSSVAAEYGSPGYGYGTVASASNGGIGGRASEGIGTVKYSGGRGGNVPSVGDGVDRYIAAGGGGAAGPYGNGLNGVDITSGTTSSYSAGGTGGNGFGGAGGISPTTYLGYGASGNEFLNGYGSGGGGGGYTGFYAGGGGAYGAGGGGCAGGSVYTGPGASGIIVINYNLGGGLFGSGITALGLG